MTTAVARISRVDGSGTAHDVQFNPPSLKVGLSNRLQDEDASGSGGQSRQNTRVTTAKLETELVYDTTESGEDVREKTRALKDMAIAAAGTPPAPAKIEFRWGNFKFVGVIESLNETLDFWAAEGVPLRATVQVVIQNVDGGADVNAPGAPAQVTLNTIPEGGTGTTGAATAAGDPGAGRAVAAANGIENMRMTAGGAVAVSASVQLQAAAGFSLSAGIGVSAGAGFGIGAVAGGGASAGIGIGASAGFAAGASAGFGASASFGAGASAGFGAGASAGFGAGASAGFAAGAGASFGASASAGFGASASAGFAAGASAGFGAGATAGFSAGATAGFGAGTSAGFSSTSFSSGRFSSASFSTGGSARASAGVSASAGAFAGLGTSRTTTSVRLDPGRLLPPPATARVGSATQFDVTGRAISTGSSGLTANVTASAGIRFG
jgi:hypothetical protein